MVDYVYNNLNARLAPGPAGGLTASHGHGELSQSRRPCDVGAAGLTGQQPLLKIVKEGFYRM